MCLRELQATSLSTPFEYVFLGASDMLILIVQKSVTPIACR